MLALNLLTLGIPCLYYGIEQRLDGRGGPPVADRYVREAMFGGGFGAFRVAGAARASTRTRRCTSRRPRCSRCVGAEPALRRGRQYLREISGDGATFGLPTGFGGPVAAWWAWSRVWTGREVLCAINTDPVLERTAWVTVDAGLHARG